jgi:hypothetical protein
MRCSSLLPLLGLLLCGRARAGACCVGTTSTVPTRLGEGEHWLAGVGVKAERALGLWDSSGAVTDISMTDEALIATLAAGWRWSPRGQVFATLPTRLNHRAAGDIDEHAAGLSDLRLGVTLNPVAESVTGHRPVPMITLGARLPTGEDWTDSQDALQTDVTGLVGPAVIAGVTAERTEGKTPWSLGVDAEAGGSGTALGGSAAIGRYLGTRWSITGGLRTSATLAGGSTTTRTNTGLTLTRGQALRWRAWISADTDVPLDGLGRGTTRQAHVGLGAAVIR